MTSPTAVDGRLVESEDVQRLWSKARADGSGCWVWQRSTSKGYGVLWVGGRSGRRLQAHRVAYSVTKGEIPAGEQVDHLCMNRSCINPNHLEAVSQQENIRRASRWNREKTICKNGHPFTEANTRIEASGYRKCKACMANTQRRYRARKAAAV